MNTETIFTIYIDVVLTHGESIHPCAKYSAFYILCDFLEKYIKFPNWSCVLNCYSERPGVFSGAEVTDEDDAYILFILFHQYKNISSFYLHKQLLPDHGKKYPSFMNIEIVEKGKVTTQKNIVLKSCSILGFCSEY